MFEPGEQIDIWVIDKRLGSGGMGSVYRCHNQAARRILAAVKILEGHIARHPEARARFIREAEILFTLEHPNIVKVRNVRVDGQHPYIEMEFVEGESLEDRLARSGGLPLDEALPLMGQIASAVAYLHRRGIRHRDIKPANILVQEGGRAKLVDFGLAMEADATRLTQGNMSFGTVSYAPPEWVDPDRLDPVGWDLYALGVVFWEMLTGAVAFPVSGEGDARQQAFQVILKKQSHPPLDPGEDVPDAVRQLIRDLTAAEPDERMADAAEIVSRLEAFDQVPNLPDLPPQQPVIERGPGGRSAEGRGGAVPADERRQVEPTILPPLEALEEREPTGQTWPLGGHQGLDDTGEGAEDPPPPAALAPDDRRAEAERPTILRADIEPPDDTRPTRRRGVFAILAGLGAVVLLAGVGGAFALGIVDLGPLLDADPGTRAVTVTAEGLDDGVPYDLALDGVAATPTDDGLRFDRVAPGERTLTFAVGPDCDAPACARGTCPDWCLSGTRPLDIPPGTQPWGTTVGLAAPDPRPVRIGASGLDQDTPVALAVEGAEGAMKGRSWRSRAVQPGPYRVRLIAGTTCDDGAEPCESDCPPGCRDIVREVVVPVGDSRHEARIAVTPPTPVAGANNRPASADTGGADADPGGRGADADPGGRGADANPGGRGADADPATADPGQADPSGGTADPSEGTPDPSEGTPDPDPPAGPTAGALVTNARFAAWLADHPDWAPDAAREAGRATATYLQGWSGRTPPAGQGARPAVHVTPLAARAYCQGRGGLASVGAAPTAWDEGEVGLGFEWRLKDGRLATLESSGVVSTAVGAQQANFSTGFRCAR